MIESGRHRESAGLDRRAMRRYGRAVLAFHAERGRSFPWRDTTDPYAVLLGEILLQRTRGEHVKPVYREPVSRARYEGTVR